MDASSIRAMLSGDRWLAEVRDAQREARELGIGGVPFVVLDGALAISGAQPLEVFRDALREAAEAPAG